MHVPSVAGYLLKHIHALAYASYSTATPLADNIYIHYIKKKIRLGGYRAIQCDRFVIRGRLVEILDRTYQIGYRVRLQSVYGVNDKSKIQAPIAGGVRRFIRT